MSPRNSEKLVAAGQKGGVAGAEVADDRFQSGPEIGRRHAAGGCQLRFHEVVEHGGDLEGADGDHDP